MIKKLKSKSVLDACCGGRMFYFDKNNDAVLFADIRDETYELCDGRSFEVRPEIEADFRDMPFDDNSFQLVVFDPPHLDKLGDSSWLAKKYGRLFPNWRDDIKKGFGECFRVLRNGGVLIFKWNEAQIKLSEILTLTENKPLFGNRSDCNSNTHWVTFIKHS